MLRAFLGSVATCVIVTVMWVTFERPTHRIIVEHDPYPAGLDSLVVSKQKIFGVKDDISGFMNIVTDPSGTTFIRITDFIYKKSFPACPTLTARLSIDNKIENSLTLGVIKATEGDINFKVPENEDYKMYTNLTLWCDTFSKEYGHAELVPKEQKGLFIK